MFVINATCNGCRLEALNFGALNIVFNTWVFLGFFTYEIWAEFKKSCGNTVVEYYVTSEGNGWRLYISGRGSLFVTC